MKVYTDLPALQFYAGVYIDGVTGKNGVKYGSRNEFCLEAQYTPNAINTDDEDNPLIKAGEKYDKTIIYQFYGENKD